MKLFRRIIIALIISTFVLSSVSCSQGLTIKIDTIDLTVGEYIDIADFVDGDFVMSASDYNVVSIISGTVLRAERQGQATITVSRGLKSASANVFVSNAPSELSISCSSPLYTTDIGSIIEFTARLENSNQDADIIWRANEEIVAVGETYQLKLDEYKRYKVTASTNGLSDSLTVLCYKPFDVPPTIQSGSNEIVNVNDELKFSVAFDNGQNPTPDIVWFVNNKKNGEGDELIFTPSAAGEYSIFASVNGIKTDAINFIAAGKAEIKNVIVDFDTNYPNIYLKWEGVAAEYEVGIGDTTYSYDDIRFSGNSFDLTGLVDLKGQSEVSLRCIGNEYYNPSEVVSVKTPVVPDEAIDYLNKKYFDGNYYMTSDQEVFDFINYAILFRPQAKKVGKEEKITFSLYMGYDSSMSAALLLSKGWALTDQTGRYSMLAHGKTQKGCTPTFEITFLTANEPDDFDTAAKPVYPSLATPRFRGGSTVLAIDGYPNGGEVETSDQLFYVVQKGYKPQPKSGSAAERIYAKAKDVLSKIIADDMSEEQKVRAIFEWIMWQNIYDYEATTILDVALAVRQPAYYLEGVFETGFAVCDGIAKSMSLLCNMVGVPCVRVVGLVVDDTARHHAWNKVYLDGAWYIVDATWGDTKVTIGGTTYEGAVHDFYLKADAQMPTHRPTYPELYPTSDSFYNWYRASEYSGGLSRYLVDGSMDELIAILQCEAEDITFEAQLGDEIIERDFYAIELCLSIKARTYLKQNGSSLSILIDTIFLENETSWVIVNDLLLIVINK
ncbi:MAG: hypothetical protein J1F36_04240 [Clostridiales bacterium]|nr:hypothetical protein [Clostridiales bacterium]